MEKGGEEWKRDSRKLSQDLFAQCHAGTRSLHAQPTATAILHGERTPGRMEEYGLEISRAFSAHRPFSVARYVLFTGCWNPTDTELSHSTPLCSLYFHALFAKLSPNYAERYYKSLGEYYMLGDKTCF